MKKVLGFLALSTFMSCGQSEKDADVAGLDTGKYDIIATCGNNTFAFKRDAFGVMFDGSDLNYLKNMREIDSDPYKTLKRNNYIYDESSTKTSFDRSRYNLPLGWDETLTITLKKGYVSYGSSKCTFLKGDNESISSFTFKGISSLPINGVSEKVDKTHFFNKDIETFTYRRRTADNSNDYAFKEFSGNAFSLFCGGVPHWTSVNLGACKMILRDAKDRGVDILYNGHPSNITF